MGDVDSIERKFIGSVADRLRCIHEVVIASCNYFVEEEIRILKEKENLHCGLNATLSDLH